MKIIGKQADQIRVWQKMSKKLVQFWNKILWTDMTIYTVHTYIMRGGNTLFCIQPDSGDTVGDTEIK